MTQDFQTGSSIQTREGLEASRAVAARLSGAARRLRFSTSSRSTLYKAVGLRPKFIDRIFVAAAILLTIGCLLLPNVLAIGYYGLLASDQYQSETRFTVRSSTPALGEDQIASVTGIPSAKIVQDTQIVVNFINSHEMLDFLARQNIDLKKVYGDPSIDWWARLPQDATDEEVLRYWSNMTSAVVSPSSGIVTVKVKAFDADMSATLVRAVIKASEAVVNQVNDRIWRDVTATAQGNLDHAKVQLQAARTALATARNKEGVLSVEGSSEILGTLITNVQGELLTLQQRYDSQIGNVSADAPQMKVLEREIQGKQKQLDELNRQLASQTEGSRTLADVSQDLSQLQLAESLAEQQFASSVRSLEQIQFVSRQQLLYLDSFLAPRVPDEALFPRRWLWIGVTLGGSLLVWGLWIAILYFVRDRLTQ